MRRSWISPDGVVAVRMKRVWYSALGKCYRCSTAPPSAPCSPSLTRTTPNPTHKLTTFGSAVAARPSGPIDWLLTAVVTPHMLGKEVAERVSATRPGLRDLYMSGSALPIFDAQGSLEAG